jgi:hypothetical protein
MHAALIVIAGSLTLVAVLTRSARFVVGHPAPLLVTLTAVLAWIGAT